MKSHFTGKLFVLISVCLIGSGKETQKKHADKKCNSDKLSHSVNSFAFDLIKQIGGDGNLFVSPLSIYIALSMVYVGSGGDTATQIAKALHLEDVGMTENQLSKSIKKRLTGYQQANKEYSLDIADGLFLQTGTSPRKDYVNKIQTDFKGEVKNVDFQQNPQGATDEINEWVSDKTHKKIEKLLSDPLDPGTYMALMNAIYFKGKWETQFNKEQTVEGDFHSGSSSKKVKFMTHRSKSFPFYQDHDQQYKFLKLPYKGDDIVMLLALPNEEEDNFTLQMDFSKFCSIQNKLEPTKLQVVKIPKFHLEDEKDLVDNLEALGIKDLFEGPADLSGISDMNSLIVSDVRHKAVIDVDEVGTEAAAATGVFMMRLSMQFLPNFVADHPFMFYIIDEKYSSILFAGQVRNPSDK